MKTNLDSLFKNDSKLEEAGIWLSLSENTGFLVRRFGGYNSPKVKAALAKHYKPYARLVDAGTMDPAKEREIMVKVFVESCIVNWKGIEIDGKEVQFSQELCVKFLTELPELSDTLVNYASDSKNYREDLGNS